MLAAAITGCGSGQHTTSTLPHADTTKTCNDVPDSNKKSVLTCYGDGDDSGWPSSIPLYGITYPQIGGTVTHYNPYPNDGIDFGPILNAVGPVADQYTGGLGTNPYSGDNDGGVVAVQPGPPTGACQTPSSQSPTQVGATIAGSTDGTNGVTALSVVDINALFEYGGIFTPKGSLRVLVSPKTVGYYYKDNAGDIWFQIDPSVAWSLQVSAGLTLQQGIMNASASVNRSQPFGTAPIYVGNTKSPPQPPTHTVAAPCFQQGSSFLPGEWYG